MEEPVFKSIPETSEALDMKLVGGSRILKCTQDREKLWWGLGGGRQLGADSKVPLPGLSISEVPLFSFL